MKYIGPLSVFSILIYFLILNIQYSARLEFQLVATDIEIYSETPLSANKLSILLGEKFFDPQKMIVLVTTENDDIGLLENLQLKINGVQVYNRDCCVDFNIIGDRKGAILKFDIENIPISDFYQVSANLLISDNNLKTTEFMLIDNFFLSDRKESVVFFDRMGSI